MNLSGKRLIFLSLMIMVALVISACPGDTATPVAPQPGVVEATPVAPAVEATPMVAETPAVVEPAPFVPGQPVGVIGAESNYMVLASTLLGRDVNSIDGEDLGDVDDLLVDLSTGNILFALITHGGFLGIGQDQAAIPLSAFSIMPGQDELILNVTEAQFETFPNVDVDNNWPTGLGAGWDTELRGFWTTAGFDVSGIEGAEPGLVVRASQLVGFGWGTGAAGVGAAPAAPAAPGVATTGMGLGNIADYIVDLGQGRIEYAVLAFGDVALYGEDWVIVPFQAIEPAPLGTQIMLDPSISPEMLMNAPRVVGVNIGAAEFFAPGWDEAIRTYWTEQGYDLDQPDTATTDVPAAQATPATQPAPGAVAPGTADTIGQPVGVTGAEQDYMILASALLGRDVDNQAGENLGSVDDFLVDLSTGNVLYVLVAHGGFLGLGQDEVAIPLSAFGVVPGQDNLILNVSEEQFETFPNIDVDDTWPTGQPAGWDAELRGFWTTTGYQVGGVEGADASMVIRGSDLDGMGFGATATGATDGNVEDYIIDMNQGRIVYAVMSFADAATFGDEWVIVPFQALQPAMATADADPQWTLDQTVSPEILTGAPRVRSDDLGNVEFLAPGWDEGVRTYWTDQGYQFQQQTAPATP